MREFFGDLI